MIRKRTIVVRNFGNASRTYTLGYDAVNPSPGVSYSVRPTSLTVGAHHKPTATLTMRVVPSALPHTLDPTMSASQSTAFGHLPRTYVSDSSGHLTVTPKGKRELRVPVYGAAKPVSDTTATAQPGEIDVSGRGVSQGSSQQDAYLSLASIFQLGATSPEQPQCTVTIRSGCWTNRSDRSGDLHYVGAASGTVGSDPFLWFGIATHHDWADLNTMTPYVDVDTDGDHFPDIEIYARNYAWAQGRTDVLLAWTVDYKTGAILDLEPVNLAQFEIDTNVYDTNVVMLPMDLTYVADGGPVLTGPDASINYWGATANGYTGHDQDRTHEATYDLGSPDLVADAPPIFEDSPEAVPVEGSGQALVFHYRGAQGHRAEVVTVPPVTPAP